jgi:hypothetical protein
MADVLMNDCDSDCIPCKEGAIAVLSYLSLRTAED